MAVSLRRIEGEGRRQKTERPVPLAQACQADEVR
jgi:hypothetical protein